MSEILNRPEEPMRNWIPADHWAFNPDVRRYPWTPIRTNELLASVGFEDQDGDGILEAYGYSGTFPDGTPEISLREQIPSAEDGWTNQNFDGWVHEKASQLIFDANSTLYRNERVSLFHEQQESFMEEMPSGA